MIEPTGRWFDPCSLPTFLDDGRVAGENHPGPGEGARSQGLPDGGAAGTGSCYQMGTVFPEMSSWTALIRHLGMNTPL